MASSNDVLPTPFGPCKRMTFASRSTKAFLVNPRNPSIVADLSFIARISNFVEALQWRFHRPKRVYYRFSRCDRHLSLRQLGQHFEHSRNFGPGPRACQRQKGVK